MNTLLNIWLKRVSLLVVEEGMIPNHSFHHAFVLSYGGLKLKCGCSSIYVQSLHVIQHFPEVLHTWTWASPVPQGDLIKKRVVKCQ